MENNQEITKPILLKDLGMIYSNENSKKKRRFGIYECSCGKEFKALTQNVNNGSTKGCGCRVLKHGLRNHRLYKTWNGMMQRCYNENNHNYSSYGAIGVTVCKEWHNVENFINDMYPSYEEGLSIDKDFLCSQKQIYPAIYSKETCIWTTKEQQSINTRIIRKNNTSGYRGVCFDNKNKKFMAYVTIKNKNIFLGYFKESIEAAKTRDKYIVDNSLGYPLNFN